MEQDAVPAAAPALLAMADGHYGARPLQRRAAPATQAAPAHYGRGPLQRRPATSMGPPGLPTGLRAGLEALAGISLDHVRVHYNSIRPAGLNALAYAQGSDIHLARGQERHLPHEAWHVVQQHQGRVQGSLRSGGVALNDDTRLEREADAMGAQAERLSRAGPVPAESPAPAEASASTGGASILQRMVGDAADGERVVARDDTGTVYIARRNTIGSYDLFDDSGDYSLSIAPDDDDFILYDDVDAESDVDSAPSFDADADDPASEADDESEDATPFSIVTDQKKRRVYTSGPTRGDSGFHRMLREGKSGFTYGEVSDVLYDALDQVDAQTAADAIATGANLPLDSGDIPIVPEQNLDLQLIPYHLLMYQKFHTPPELKSKKRARENPWRQEELDNTRDWLTLPNAEGLKHVLPRKRARLRDYYPGPIDVHFAPGKDDLLNYGDNKAIYVLNREVLLKAYLQAEEAKQRGGTQPSRRRLQTDALFEVIGSQADSTATGNEEQYVRRTFGLKRTDSDSSLDEASSEEAVEDFDLGADEAPQDRAYRRKTYANTLGLLVKRYTRKILEDLQASVVAKDQGETDAAEASLQKHRGLLSKLEKKYGEMALAHREAFKSVDDTISYITKKKQMLQKIPVSDEMAVVRKRYIESLEQYLLAEPRGADGGRPLDRVGQKNLERRLTSAMSTETRRGALRALAREHGGTLRYGSGNGNNCLIYAIANAVGFAIDDDTVAQIRDALYDGDYAGVDESGYLPATTRVVDVITQFVLGELQARSADELPAVTVHVLTVLPGIAPVVVGADNADDAQAYVIHDGGHYWWLDTD